MEETLCLTEDIAEKMLELIQRFTLYHFSFVPPEHIIQLNKQLESSEYGSADRASNYSVLLRVFAMLAHSETPPSMSELGIALNLPFSSTTRVVDWLVRANLLERTGDPDDRRIVRVRLTENGRQIYQTGMEYNKEKIVNYLTIFTPEEQEQILRLMNKLANAVAQSPANK
jgi:DNA-binding MarR family transcriptional regulator